MGHYGIVYIARNDQHPPNVYKIGASNRNVEERMRELSNETATYGTFEAKASFPVTDWEAAEKKCHNQLSKYRAGKKEFFKAPYNELLEVVRNVCDVYQPKRNVEQPTDGMSKALFLKQALPIPTQRALAEQEKAHQAFMNQTPAETLERISSLDVDRLKLDVDRSKAVAESLAKQQSELRAKMKKEDSIFAFDFAGAAVLGVIMLVCYVILSLLGFT